jgi:multidrug efflux pump
VPLRAHEEPGRLARLFEREFHHMVAFYDRTLAWIPAHQPLTLAVTIATLLVRVLLAVVIPKGLFPVQDTGLVTDITVAPSDVCFAGMMNRQREVAEAVLQDPAVATVASFIGADGTNATTNGGRLSIALRPRDERGTSASEVIDRLRARLAGLEGVRVYMHSVHDLQIDARASQTQYQYMLEDPDIEELAQWAPRVVARLQQLPELRDVASHQETSGLQVNLTIDRDTADERRERRDVGMLHDRLGDLPLARHRRRRDRAAAERAPSSPARRRPSGTR